MLLLTSVIGSSFVMKPSLAGNAESNTSGEISEKMSDLASSEEACGRDVKKGETMESPGQNAFDQGDQRDLDDVSEWGRSAQLDFNKTRLIVGVNGEKHTLLELEEMITRHQAETVSKVSIRGKVIAIVVELPLESVTRFMQEVRVAGLASYVEPSMKVQALFAPNDPYWDLQWGPQKIEVDWAWNTTIGNASVLVAVIDTGIDYTHPDLTANYVPLGYDWANNDADPMDDHGHGTHCAGIIAATLNNSVGIAGLAQVRIMTEKVLDSTGNGLPDWLASGIIHAVDQGADIISISLGGYGDSELVHDALRYAYSAGVLVIVAAGNNNSNIKPYPAGYEEVVAVAATDQNDGKAYFSNWGDWIELAAPGVDIYSTIPAGYASWSGTSMACPHVTGVAALVISLYPVKTRDWVRLWLRSTADDLGNPGFDVYYGYGRVNARRAVEQTPPVHELIAYEWGTPPYVEPGTSQLINATVLNFGETDETDVTVQLMANGTLVDSTIIGVLTGGNSTRVSLAWDPTDEGAYNLTLYVVPVLGEGNLENNVLWRYVYSGFALKAVVLHSAGNIQSNTITNWQTLNNEWYLFGGTMIYIDYTTLNKETITYEDIAATGADVLIVSCAYDPYAGWQFTDAEIEAIGKYVHEGHGLIATAGTFYQSVPNNNKLAPLFGMDESTSWTGTGTDLLRLLNTTHPILAGVPNPLVFPQVDTALPYDGQWDSDELTGGEYLAIGNFRESAIVSYRGLVYISPWLEIIPPYYHHHLQLLYNAIIWSRYQKPEHDLTVSLDAPKRIGPRDSAILNATVYNGGKNDETDVELKLFVNGGLVDEVSISTLPTGSFHTMSYLWSPTAQGAFNITAYVPPVAGEVSINNKAEKAVMVLLLNVRDVLVYSDDYIVEPHSRYVIIALDELGINYTYCSNDPTGFAAALVSHHWDLVVVDHCDYYAIGRHWHELEEYVRNGGLLVLSTFDVDGSDSEPTTLWETLGVRWASDMSSPQPVYRWMPSHPLLNFPNIVGNLTQYVDDYYDDGDHVYATTGTPVAGFTTSQSEGNAAIVEGQNHQTVLFSFTVDEFRFDQDGDGRLDAVELWQNAIVYLAGGTEHDLAVSLETPTYLEPGSSSLLNATVRNRGLNDEYNVQLQMLINGTTVDSAVISELFVTRSYTLSYTWAPALEASYNITAYASPVPGEENTANNVATKRVDVRPIKHVLFDQTHGTDSILSYGNWITSMNQRGCIIETHTSGPITPSILEGYEVFVISQAHSSYTPDELSAIQNFVFDGGGFLVIGDDYPWIYTSLTDFAGITWLGGGFSGVTTDITPHFVTTGVTSVYLAAPMAIMNVTGSAQGLVRDTEHNIMLAVSEQSSGRVIGFADEDTLMDSSINQADNLRLANNMIDWLAVTIQYEHELAVTLKAPTTIGLGNSVLLNAAVRNFGLSNETNVELSLLVNSTTVSSHTISELLAGESYMLNYSWTPTTIGACNITAFAPPVPEENRTLNNRAVEIAYVSLYTRTYLANQWVGGGVPMGWHADDSSWSYTLPFDFPFYYATYRTVYISSNGLISFNAPDSSLSNTIPALAGKLAIAPAWDDWVTYDPYDIFIWENSTHVGIRWYARLYGTSIAADFEAILGSDGVIQFGYGYCGGIVSATVGISNGAGDFLAEDVTDISYMNTIVFVRAPFKNDVAITSVELSTHEALVGDTVHINVTAENQGNATEDFTVTAYASSPNSTRIYFDPSDYIFDATAVSIGYRFNLTVEAEDVSDLVAWDVGLSYDDSIINMTRWFEPTWDSEYVFYGRDTIFPAYTYSHLGLGSGYIMGMASLYERAVSFVGSKKLCVIEFEITAIPEQVETLSCDLLIDNDDTFLLDSAINVIPAIKENGYYALIWGAPPPPPPPGIQRIGTAAVTELAPGKEITLTFTWNTVYVTPSYYRIWAEASAVLGESNRTNNFYVDGIIRIEKLPVASFTHSPLFPKPAETVTFNASGSTPDGGTIISYTWQFGDQNTTTTTDPIITHAYGLSGLYNVTLTITDSAGLTDSTWRMIYVMRRDVAVVDVTPYANYVYVGRAIAVNVTVTNNGELSETFDVTLYYNVTLGEAIGTKTVMDLLPGEYRTLTLLWNTTGIKPCRNYTMTAYATPVFAETNTADNTLSSPTSVKVKLLGDINGDGKIDAKDVAAACVAYGSYPGHPRWNLGADINSDGKIDVRDIAVICRSFGQSCI
jgi:thermitase